MSKKFKPSSTIKAILVRGAETVGAFFTKVTAAQVQEVVKDLHTYLAGPKLADTKRKPSRVSYLQAYFADFPKKAKDATKEDWAAILFAEPRYNALRYMETREEKRKKRSGSGLKQAHKRIVGIVRFLSNLSPDFVMRRLQSYDAMFEMLTTNYIGLKDAEAEKILALAKIQKPGRKESETVVIATGTDN